jgi:hypothetical protein
VYLSTLPKERATIVAAALWKSFLFDETPSWSADNMKEWVDDGVIPEVEFFPPNFSREDATDEDETQLNK